MPRSASPHRKSPVKHTSIQVQKPSSSLPMNTPIQSSFGQTVLNGLAFGTGSAIAHRIVGATPTIFTGSDTKLVEDLCHTERMVFENCMKIKSSDDFCGSEQTMYRKCLHPKDPYDYAGINTRDQ